MKRAILAAILLAASPALAEEHLPAGTRIERPGLPIMVTGTGELGAWIFSRSDVERVVVDEDDLQRCRVDLRACQAAVGKQATVQHEASTFLPWVVGASIVAAFALGVDVGVRAR